MKNLLAALMTKTAGSALSTYVGGRIYLDYAPEGVVFPYIIFFIVSDVPDNLFIESIEDVMIQFSLFSTSQGATEITTMYANLNSLFDNCTMPITDNTLMWMKRQNLTTIIDEVTTPIGTLGVRHWAVDFSVYMQKN